MLSRLSTCYRVYIAMFYIAMLSRLYRDVIDFISQYSRARVCFQDHFVRVYIARARVCVWGIFEWDIRVCVMSVGCV